MNILNKILMIVFALFLSTVLITACGSQEKDDDGADAEGQEMMEKGDHEGHDHDTHEGHDHGDSDDKGNDDDQHAAATYYCPMKCEGETTYDKAGSCPVCGMDLVVVEEQEENL